MSKSEMDVIKQLVNDQLTEHGAMKGVWLVTKVAAKFYSDLSKQEEDLSVDNIPHPNVVEIINNMVANREICEVEYVLTGTNRIKSVYFAAGTELRIV